MITQGWPLWAVSRATGQVWAVVGWDVRQVGVNASRFPLGMEIGPEVDEPAAVVLRGPVSFATDAEAVRRMTA